MLQKYMTDGLYKNKYRIKSTRLAGYDYARDGYYFVTICTENREMFFGNVVGGKMILNEIGKLVADEWKKTEIIRPNVFLYERVIMPNHIHGILIINNSKNGIRTMRTTPMAIIQPK